MALSITSVDKNPACDHVTVTVNQEGTSRTFKSHLGEIDSMFSEMDPLEQLKLLVLLWAKYRRAQGRTVQGVVIA